MTIFLIICTIFFALCTIASLVFILYGVIKGFDSIEMQFMATCPVPFVLMLCLAMFMACFMLLTGQPLPTT